MKRRLAFALLAAAFTGDSFAADWPVTVISPAYYPDRLVPIEWTGLYFGVNAGYGWAKESPVKAAARSANASRFFIGCSLPSLAHSSLNG